MAETDDDFARSALIALAVFLTEPDELAWEGPSTWDQLEGERLGITPIEGGWTVFEIGPHNQFRIDILQMIHNYRIVETYPGGKQYRRYWCFGKRDSRLDDVVEAAREWMGDLNEEPQGWIKAFDGRRGGRLLREEQERWEQIAVQNAISGRKELPA